MIRSTLIFILCSLSIVAFSQNESPKPFAERLEPCNRILNLMDEGWYVWGCAPIYGPEGKVHVFFARWRIEEEDWYEHEWTRSGQIVHAIAEQAEGPYKVLEVVCEGSGGDNWDNTGVINPQIHKIDDQYVLIYTGARDQGIRNQGIGMLIAPTLYGPWKRVSDKKALVETSKDKDAFDSFMCNNPALVKAPDGRYFMYYKGRSLTDYENRKGWRRIGLAIASELEGPYTKYAGNPVLDHAPVNYEDPYVWIEDGKFEMLMHDMTFFERGAGLYLESRDGINWSEPVKGYPSTLKIFGVKQRLETPILLRKNGKPEYLFNSRGASENENIYSGFVWKIKE